MCVKLDLIFIIHPIDLFLDCSIALLQDRDLYFAIFNISLPMCIWSYQKVSLLEGLASFILELYDICHRKSGTFLVFDSSFSSFTTRETRWAGWLSHFRRSCSFLSGWYISWSCCVKPNRREIFLQNWALWRILEVRVRWSLIWWGPALCLAARYKTWWKGSFLSKICTCRRFRAWRLRDIWEQGAAKILLLSASLACLTDSSVSVTMEILSL